MATFNHLQERNLKYKMAKHSCHLYDNSHIKYQPTYANLLSSNMINPKKPFPVKHFIEINNMKKNPSHFIACVQTSNTRRVKNHTQLDRFPEISNQCSGVRLICGTVNRGTCET